MAQPALRPIRHALPRGVYSAPYLDGRVYFYVKSDGIEGVWRFQREHETPDDVIAALGDALDAADRRLPPSARFASPRVRGPHLRLLASAPR